MEVQKECCDKCKSLNVSEKPTIIKYDDGTTEQDNDKLQANCLDCGHNWIILYI